jgi:hypothetical protein
MHVFITVVGESSKRLCRKLVLIFSVHLHLLPIFSGSDDGFALTVDNDSSQDDE